MEVVVLLLWSKTVRVLYQLLKIDAPDSVVQAVIKDLSVEGFDCFTAELGVEGVKFHDLDDPQLQDFLKF